MASIAEKVQHLRTLRGWTLKQLSTRAHVSVSHLNALEKGTRKNPSFSIVAQVADAFGVPISYFRSEVPVGQFTPTVLGESVDTPTQIPASIDLQSTLGRLYDVDTRSFIASEEARPYVVLAKQLAEQSQTNPTLDAPAILQVIAAFIRDRETTYDSH